MMAAASYFMLLLVNVGIHIVVSAVIGPEKIRMDTKQVSGGYFREHKHLVTYEATAKVFFTLNLPSINAPDPGDCGSGDVACSAQKSAFEVKKGLDDFMSHMAQGKSRRKRQVSLVVAGAAGFLLHTVFSKFSRKIFGTNHEAAELIGQYRGYLVANSKQHLYFNASIESLAKGVTQMSSRYWFLDRMVDRRDKAQLFLSQVHIASLNYQLGIERCLNHRIPMQFLPSAILKKKLVEVEKSLNSEGYRLSIPIKNLDEYYKVHLCDCMFSNTTAYMLVNVPAEKYEWKISDFIPISFALGNQTCALQGSDNLIAVSKARVEVIDPKLSPFCDTVKDSLCYVPSFSFHMQTCTQIIYSGGSLEDILSSCEMKCRNNRLVQVVNVDRNVVIITNGKSLEVDCNDRTLHYKLNDTGATQVNVKCLCSYKIDGSHIDLRPMCDAGLFNDTDVTNIIPSYLPDPELLKNAPNVTNSSEILEHILPNMSYPVMELPSSGDSFLPYRDVWIIVVSVVQVMIFLACTGFLIYLCHK